MNCNEARQHLMLFLDSEGDPQLHFRISDHLAMCPRCAEWFGKQQRLERVLNERIASGEATPELWDRVLAASGMDRSVAGRRLWIAATGLAVAATVMAAWVFRFSISIHGSELSVIAADWHEGWAGGGLKPDLESDSDQEVEEYLKKQLPFRVHCPPRKDVQFAVAGAGVRAAGNQTAAYIVGRVGENPVSILVLARNSLDAFPIDRSHLVQGAGRHRCRERGYQMISGTTPDNVVVVIGTATAESLERVLNAYGSYHEPRG